MSELVLLNIGQAGSQIGESVTRHLAQACDIDYSGAIQKGVEPDNLTKIFFHQTSTGIYNPRCNYIDLEPTVTDRIRKGQMQRLFKSSQFIAGQESASNNYARGKYTIGKELIDKVIDQARREVERADNLQGFCLFFGSSGGTGSGFSSLLMQRLRMDFGKQLIVPWTVLPSLNMGTHATDMFNFVICSMDLVNQCDFYVKYDNETLYKACQVLTGNQYPNFTDINELISNHFYSIVSQFRRSSSQYDQFSSSGLTKICTNMKIFNGMNGFSGGIGNHLNYYENSGDKSTSELVDNLLTRQYNLFVEDGKDYMNSVAFAAFFQGDHSSYSILDSRDKISSTINLVISKPKKNPSIQLIKIGFLIFNSSWTKTEFMKKTGVLLANQDHYLSTIFQQKCKYTQKSASSLVNNIGYYQYLQKITNKWDSLYYKRGFVHWHVGEGMSQGEHNESREDMANAINSYKELLPNIK